MEVFDFEEKDFELGGKQWQIKPMLAIPAKALFYKHVRPCLAVMGDLEVTRTKPDGTESSLNEGQILLGVIGKIPQEHLTALTETLLNKCLWVNDEGKMRPVRENKEVFLAGLKISELTILDARLFAVNFGQSVSELIGLFIPQGAEVDQGTAQ